MTVSTELARLTAERKITGYRLAIRIGVNRTNVTRWLNGARTPELDNVARISVALNLSNDEIAGLVRAAAPPAMDSTP